jgi:cytidyltransferase-like protein
MNGENNSKLILQYDKLAVIVGALKTLNKVIVLLSGTWDLLHVGHCRYFRSAIEAVMKATGKTKKDVILIVGVDNDEEVKKRKGKFRPIVPQDERTEMLKYLEDIDYIVLKQEEEQSWVIGEIIKPDYLILSESTTFINAGSREDMVQKLKEWAADVIILPPQATTSTTGKIRTLLTGTIVDVRTKFESVVREKFESIIEDFSSFLNEISGGD